MAKKKNRGKQFQQKDTGTNQSPGTEPQTGRTEPPNPVACYSLALMAACIVFSATSYTLRPLIYILVPVLAAFIITFLLPRDRWAVFGVMLITGGLSLVFADGPGTTGDLSSPHLVIQHILSMRQNQMLSYTPPLLLGILGGALGWGSATLIRGSRKVTGYITWGLVLLFLINFVAITMDLNPAVVEMVFAEPAPGQFNNFNSMNLLTFYDMKEGKNFYQAYSDAFSQREQSWGQTPENIWSWRSPVVFYLWWALLPPDGFFVLYLYILLVVVTLLMVFDISSFYLPAPVNMLPVILSAYPFIYGGVAFWFTFPEFWGVCFLIMGIWGIYRKLDPVVVAGFTLAILTRGFFFFGWMVLMIVLIARREERKKLALMSLPGLIFVIGIFFHLSAVARVVQWTAPQIGEWFSGGPSHISAILSFGSILLSGGGYMAGLMVILFLAGTYLHRQDHRILILSGTALVPLLLFFRLGPGTERAYWGAAILPQIMIMATLTLSYPIKILQLEKDMYKQINPVSPGGQIPQENKEIIQ